MLAFAMLDCAAITSPPPHTAATKCYHAMLSSRHRSWKQPSGSSLPAPHLHSSSAHSLHTPPALTPSTSSSDPPEHVHGRFQHPFATRRDELLPPPKKDELLPKRRRAGGVDRSSCACCAHVLVFLVCTGQSRAGNHRSPSAHFQLKHTQPIPAALPSFTPSLVRNSDPR